jgi:hypothetical protein
VAFLHPHLLPLNLDFAIMDAIPYTTVIGWTFIIGVGGACYYYNSQYNKNGRKPLPVRRQQPAVVDRAEVKPNKPKGPKGPRAAKDAKPVPEIKYLPVTEEKEDLSWVHDLARQREGTKMNGSKKPSTEKKAKFVKQNRANKPTESTSGPSSTTGADADDDLSPAMSPSLPADVSQSFPSGNDVSDMLEAPSAGPSVLKLTAPTQPAYTKSKPAPRVAPQEKTKKDRQNEKKKEAAKAERQAQEKVRRDLEEQQRRRAREARGEPAKNGMAPAKAPNSSAWANGNGTATPKQTVNHGLLDTYEKSVPANGSANGNAASGNKWWATGDLPSEEEQERILQESDPSAWNTVGPKKNKNTKKSKQAESVIEDDSSEHSGNAAPAVQPADDPRVLEDFSAHGTYHGATVPESAWTVV